MPGKEKLNQIEQEFNKDRDESEDIEKIHEIELYWHDFFQSPEDFMPDSTIEQQIEILNDAYAGNAHSSYFPFDCGGNRVPAGPDTSIRFKLIETYRNYCDANGRGLVRDSMEEKRMKKMSRKGDCSALNIYTVDTAEFLGWSNFPWDCNEDSNHDGVVISRNTVPGEIGTKERVKKTRNFSEGDILVHEVGHWLGLFHTFGENEEGSCDPGDYVSDTAPIKRATMGCPKASDTCNNDKMSDPVHNYMDYSDNCCTFEFTKGQISRMKAMVRRYRQKCKDKDEDHHDDNYYVPDTKDQVDDFYENEDDFFDGKSSDEDEELCFCIWKLCYGCGRCYI